MFVCNAYIWARVVRKYMRVCSAYISWNGVNGRMRRKWTSTWGNPQSRKDCKYTWQKTARISCHNFETNGRPYVPAYFGDSSVFLGTELLTSFLISPSLAFAKRFVSYDKLKVWLERLLVSWFFFLRNKIKRRISNRKADILYYYHFVGHCGAFYGLK